ncbi:DUF6279 family lipoprotein [Ramlibacter sp. Leaf400]|uniref:DUF6279 family lipoprotein n=1 Tax=Ramlibacter sp. Leaf400 TaxID=1736365 RepID=UPI000700E3D5|nr:DUF6279 family lipoprotein [Ramlibacter sp. Leaf400]KQT09430.1 hypothetical protein ASG30_12725 [Ramlibacter sp. Leaf400]
MSFPFFTARHVPRLARIIGLLSLALALAGCSTLKLGYSTLPEIAYWWLDSYIDLEDGQSQRLREDLQRLHAWHRANELPRLVALLERMEKLAPQDATPAQVCAFEPELRERYAAARERAEPAIVTNALTVTPAQLDHLQRRYARNNRDFEKNWIRPPPAEQIDRRMKLVGDRLEAVYGTLTEPQRAALRRHLEASPFPAAQVLAERKRRQQDTLAVLQRLTAQQVSLGDARAALRGLLDRFTESPDPAYRAYQAESVQDLCRMVATVHNAAGPPQREQAARRLRGWQRDLGELSSAP